MAIILTKFTFTLFLLISVLLTIAITIGQVIPRQDWDMLVFERYIPPYSSDPPHLSFYDVPHRILFNVTVGYVPSWSPDGQTLAYTVAQDRETDIHFLDIASMTISQVVFDAGFPHWLRNGDILYINQENNQPHLMNGDGTNRRRLDAPLRYDSGDMPARLTDQRQTVAGVNGSITIQTILPAALYRQVTPQRCPLYDFRWSPDDKRIAVSGCGELWIYDLETETLTEIHNVQHEHPYAYFEWSSDGRRIVFQTLDRREYARLIIIDLETGKVTPFLEIGTHPSRFDFRPVTGG